MKFKNRKQAGELLADALSAGGEWYDDFAQTTDEEVIALMGLK